MLMFSCEHFNKLSTHKLFFIIIIILKEAKR